MASWSDLQLQFDLPEMDEVEGDATERAISAAEARMISEAARGAFEAQSALTPSPSPDSGRGGEEEGEGPSPLQVQDERGWVGEYLRLRELGWPWRVAAYLAWASSPRRRRWPVTLKDLAVEVLGLRSPRVIYEWRRKYPSIDAVVATLQAAPLFEHRRDVIEALVEMAGKPDYKAHNDRKLFLEMVGDYVPRSKVELGRSGASEGLGGLSDDELRGWLGGDAPSTLTPNPSPDDGRGEKEEGENE